jgi:hypothetical protein
VVVGRWETLPLRTLEKALLDSKIADSDTLKASINLEAKISGARILYE